MALEDLVNTIETIKNRIENHRQSLAVNETRTRQVLIDPLLHALGWDVSDPVSVELEYDVRGKRADYALLVDGNPAAVIEAKRLGNPLVDDNTMQVMNYANTAGIEYMMVTNGEHWNMYSVFERGAIEERVIMELRLDSESAHVTALHSLSLWRANLGSGSAPAVANKPVFSRVAETGDEKDSLAISETVPQRIEPPTRQLGSEKRVNLSETINTNRGAPKPTEIGFPDGSTVKIGKWIELWIEIAEWVVKTKSVRNEFRFGKNKHMVMKSVDEGFWTPGRQLKNGLWVEKTLSARNAVSTSRQLLEYFGIDARSVRVNFEGG